MICRQNRDFGTPQALEEAGVATPLRVEAVAVIEREGHAAKLKLVKRHPA